MPTRTRHVATVTDPVTGEEHELAAASAAELDQLLEDHLSTSYPLPTPAEPPAPD